ncbi:hypothetical protein OG204_23460 [Streptomyces sp. NBC_01387]|uniref:hypothetical protein n=1 Tax=unclassified Streptomyces TaxID=2593676 RepID=UPI002024A4A6|nr:MULTISPECIES: hypothetical protein [unclassified Streptomyces]MCX4548723.1 hypothetical protein [Streptomyces sp. NBC_01500]WSC20316.1 hypothetical protein OIE60_11815 [Streptomyces sp. NBC_01766]WSV54350.1 hypothetical protein OG282_11875 [Streptomyces sp. NBC_01014]
MDFNITAEEEALLLRIREHLHAGNRPGEAELAAELGDDVRAQVRSLGTRGWLVVRPGSGGEVYVEGLSTLAESALSNRRDVGDR